MLGWMVRDIAERRPRVQRLVSYQNCEVHRGTIYKASGWTPTSTPGGGEWNHTNRKRVARRIKKKVRWEHFLKQGASQKKPLSLTPNPFV
jgi:hypothetical protein